MFTHELCVLFHIFRFLISTFGTQTFSARFACAAMACHPDMSQQSVATIAAAAHKRCFFLRDGVLNVDAHTDACELAHLLAYMDHFRLLGASGPLAFDVHCGCGGLRVLSLAGFDWVHLRTEFRRTLDLILETNLFEDVVVIATAKGTLHATLTLYSCAARPPLPVGALRLTAGNGGEEATAAWWERVTSATAFEFAVDEWSLDLRGAVVQFVLQVLHAYGARPVVLRFYDCTEEEEGYTDMLITVATRAAAALSDPWSLHTCRLARYVLMEGNSGWASTFVRTHFGDVFQCVAQCKQRLYWDGYCTSLGCSKDIVSLSRLSAFREADLWGMTSHLLQLLAGTVAATVNLSATAQETSITLDLRGEVHFCGHDAGVMTAHTTMHAWSVPDIMAWLAGRPPLRFIVVHMRRMPDAVRACVTPLLVLPLWAAARYGRLYARIHNQEVVIQINDSGSGSITAGSATGPMPLTTLAKAAAAKACKKPSRRRRR